MTSVLVALAAVLVVHGALHLLGVAKAFGLAELSALSRPISAGYGVLWLAAAALFFAAAISLFMFPRAWTTIAVAAVGVSVIVILRSWADARFGLIPDAVVFVVALSAFLSQGPFSVRAEYERDVERHLAHAGREELVTPQDLEHVPEPVRRYLRNAGVVGMPRVRNFRATMHGRIRGSPADRWIRIASEQYDFVDDGARLFYFKGWRLAVPVQGYHRYADVSATMRVTAAGLARVVDASGAQLTRSETVTFFNDICLLAPAALISRNITWTDVGARSVVATFRMASGTIRAELIFDDAGDLANFISDDRYELSADGRHFKEARWSTPIRAYRWFGGVRAVSEGEGRWHNRDGEYAYIDLTIDSVEYNVVSPRWRP